MTVSVDGVRIQKRPRSRGLLWSIIAIEAILSVIVYISFAAHFIWPDTTRAAAGVSSMLSYEGRLTDTSGNPLGGTGTQYCFRFSIYDASSGGTKLWPAGTPSVTLATTTDGVFTALVGQADSLTYNFYDSDTVYLNVEAYSVAASGGTCTGGSYETLSPRQQIAATGYARSSANVYSALLFTDNTNNRVQIGTGVGGGSPKFLGLDVKNTNDYIGQSCTTSGTVWYNSAISKALVCENGTIQAISNSSATTTLAALTANTDTPAVTGTIVFSNSNGVTFGINGNTITASVAGGAAGTLSSYAQQFPASTGSQTLGAMGTSTASAFFFPISVVSNVQFNALRVALSLSSFATSTISGQKTISSFFGLFSNNASTLSLISSNSLSFAMTNSSVSGTVSFASATGTAGYSYGTITASTTAQLNSFFGSAALRRVDLQFGNTMSITPGMYWLGVLKRESTSSANIGMQSAALAGNVMISNASLANIGSASSAQTTVFNLRAPYYAFGPYTSTGSAGYGGTALPSSVFISGVAQTGTVLPFMTFMST